MDGNEYENGSHPDINGELFELNRALKNSTKVLARAMKQEKDTSAVDNMQKLQQDRLAKQYGNIWWYSKVTKNQIPLDDQINRNMEVNEAGDCLIS